MEYKSRSSLIHLNVMSYDDDESGSKERTLNILIKIVFVWD